MYVNASVTDGERLYIADAGNHAIRISTAVCSKVCENGGYERFQPCRPHVFTAKRCPGISCVDMRI